MKKISYLLLILLTTTLTACGGGGKNANSNTTSNSGSSSTISSGGSTTSSSGGSTSSSGGSTTGSNSQCIPPTYGPTSGSLAITTNSCPATTQGGAYSGCQIQATGGTPPYTFNVVQSSNYPPLPEGMTLESCNGNIISNYVGGQGYYQPEIQVTDANGNTVAKPISFEIAGNNSFMANIFPSNSIFHTNISTLPVDNSPAAQIYSGYLSSTIKPFFGNTSGAPFPNGIPAIEVPYNQPNVAVSTTVYQSYFNQGPIPSYAPVEGTSSSSGDRHVLVYQDGNGTQNPSLYEMWVGINLGSSGWTDSSNALWSNTNSNALTPLDNGTSDAAGLPVAPLLVTASEVIGTGTPSNPNGVVKHPIRFTLNHMLNYYVWPATSTAGVGSCTDSSSNAIPVRSELSQSTPPSSCSFGAPAGEIYRLKSTVSDPSCAATSPQAKIIMTAMRNYGIIVADNGITGGLIGTPDSRWNDTDLSCLSQLTLADFEPVNVSSLMISPTSGQIQ